MENKNVFPKLKEVLKFVYENKYSDFYRLKYERAGFNPLSDFNSIDDIKKIPFLTREELSAAEPLNLLFMKKEDVDLINVSSGTSGDPLLTFCSIGGRSPYRIEEVGDIELLLLPSVGNSISLNFISKEKGKWLLAGDVHNIPASLKLASKLKADTISTIPTLAIILKDYLGNYPDLKKSLKFLKLGGEVVSPLKKNLLQKLYPDVKIFMRYGISEIGSGRLMFQCSSLAERNDQVLYHLRLDGDHYFEFINPDTEKEAESQEKGELVVTNLQKMPTPLIRYKTGDLMGIHENDCPCGLPGSLLEALGRAQYDLVRVGGVQLRRDMAEKPITNLRDYLEQNFEAHIYENFVGNKPKIKMVLNLSLKKGVEESPELKQKIENEILENWQLSSGLNLKKAVETGLFEALEINFVEFPHSLKARQVLILHND